jgi:hypothetical protein
MSMTYYVSYVNEYVNAREFVAMVTRNCVMTMTNLTITKLLYMDVLILLLLLLLIIIIIIFRETILCQIKFAEFSVCLLRLNKFINFE